MPHIIILSTSVRTGRDSHRAALYFQNYITENKLGTPEIVDLNEYQFPIFDERLKFMKNPDAKTTEFADKISKTDGIIIVTPEYNGGYPASLKNVVDLLYDQWKRKPIGIVTVSSGAFGGSQVITSLLFTLWKIGAWVVPAMFPVAKVKETFDEKGAPADAEGINKRAKGFLNELLWCMEANGKMK